MKLFDCYARLENYITSINQDSLLLFGVYYFQALEILPQNTFVADIVDFLEKVMEETAAKKRSLQVLRNLSYAEHLQVGAYKSCFDSFLLLAFSIVLTH